MASFILRASAITLLLILFLSPTNAVLILDLNNQPIIKGENYNIIPYPNYGGLTTSPVDSNSPCPRYINESRNLGTPVTISSLSKTMFLTTTLPIQFSFYENFPICNKLLRWWVAPKDSIDESYVIVGTDGPFKPSYYFKIKKDKKIKLAYNIKFCHVLEFSSDLGGLAVMDEECNDVGFLKGRLGITPNKPFPVQFLGFAPRLAS